MRNRLLIFGIGTVVLGLGQSVSLAAPPSADSSLDLVTVTASRVRRDGYEAPTPTTVLDFDDLTLRPPDTLADLLSRVPQMRNAANEGTGGVEFGQFAGRGFVNLRGLGLNRTLVLLDGARPVSNSLSGARDILALPSALVTRVDVVTGGTSSLYGSDAIAGVVNFVLDSRFTGFKATVEGGTSARSDATASKVSAAWGEDLSDRWHLMGSVELFGKDGVTSPSRSFATAPAIVPNPRFTATNGERPLVVVDNAYDAKESPGGLILNGPLAGQQFLANGATEPYVPASCTVSQPYVLCDSRQDLSVPLGTLSLTSPQRRVAGFGRLTYRITPDVEAHFDATLSRSRTTLTQNGFETTGFALQIPIDVVDNPFLPEPVRSRYLAAGETSLLMGRQNTDEGRFQDVFRESVENFSVGLNVHVGSGWMLRTRATYGQADTGERWVNVYSIDRFFEAIDAVSVNGTPTCRINAVTVTRPACAPADIFGSGNMSAAAKAYFLGDIRKPLKTSQRELALDLTGEPLSLWAGPVSLAAGASYREERTRQLNDGTDAGFAFAGYPAFSGGTDVSEAYSQAVIPIARGLALAKSIDLDLAARWVRYSGIGSELPWKIGLNWTPLQGLRFRFSKSEDIRAPNVLELNLPQFEGGIVPQLNPLPNGVPLFNSLGVAPGQTVAVREIGGGNLALESEIAHTTSFGLVFQSALLQGLTASIDHYRIRIADAITTLPTGTIVRDCAAGNAAMCELIGFSAVSSLPTVAVISLNAQSFVTSGLDAEARYAFRLFGGEATIRALTNYITEYEQKVAGASSQDLLGDTTSGLPKLQGDLSVAYRHGSTTAFLSGVYIGSGTYRKSMSAEIQNNHVPHVWYVDATVDQRLGSFCAGCSVYAAVSNLFDQRPPHPGYGMYTNIESSFFTGVPYDRVGRFFKIGLRVAL